MEIMYIEIVWTRKTKRGNVFSVLYVAVRV